jgi:hypothetical protein
MDGKIAPCYGPSRDVPWQDRLYQVPWTIDGEDGPTLLALHYVGGVPREPRGADEYKSLLRPRQVQRVSRH